MVAEVQAWRFELRSQPETPPTVWFVAAEAQRNKIDAATVATISFTAHFGLNLSIFDRFVNRSSNSDSVNEILLHYSCLAQN